MMTPEIFVSYNPKSEIEQSTALRLQTLSSLYGAIVHLPDRVGSSGLKETTKQKILKSQVFVMFSTANLSEAVKQEIEYALKSDKRVVIFYDKVRGKNLDTFHIKNKNLVEAQFDPRKDDTATILKKVMDHGGFLGPKSLTPLSKRKNGANTTNMAIGALVGVGLGLLALWALTRDKKS